MIECRSAIDEQWVMQTGMEELNKQPLISSSTLDLDNIVHNSNVDKVPYVCSRHLLQRCLYDARRLRDETCSLLKVQLGKYRKNYKIIFASSIYLSHQLQRTNPRHKMRTFDTRVQTAEK